MHVPVLLEKVIEYLNPQPNENFVDCTVGAGGHALALLERNGAKGKILGIDWDENAIQNIRNKIQDTKYRHRLILVHGNYRHLKEIVSHEKFQPVHGILLDLGVSSDQLEKSGRGFSFQKSEPLDMRFDASNPMSAEKLVNYSNRYEIEKILKEYGQEQFAHQIANAITQERSRKPIRTTAQLVRIILEATPRWYQRRKIHAATKTFLALRIAVNRELENLSSALAQSAEVLNPGGRLVVISFHSLEDRIVKQFLKQTASFAPLTKKAVIPSDQEIKNNPRARSAKLRAAVKHL